MSNIAKLEEQIAHELQVLEAMAEEMPRYLQYGGLFYPLSQANYPRLTLGSYLMRQHRLAALADEMDAETAARLAHAINQFYEAIDNHLVRVEQHANEELETRTLQWDTYLDELAEKPDEYEAYFATHAADRTIIKALFDFMQPPYQPNRLTRQQVDLLDFALRSKWEDGPFIWADVWRPAYPQQHYWWLYGRPALNSHGH